MCLAGANQALEEDERDGSRVIKIFTARKIEVVMGALKQLNSVLEDGERPVIIGYPEWIGNVDIAGFAMGGTKEKLGMDCSLVVKNPETVAICAAELLSQKIMGEKEEKEPKKYDVKVKYEF